MVNNYEIILSLFCCFFLQVQVDNLQIFEVVPDILLHDKSAKEIYNWGKTYCSFWNDHKNRSLTFNNMLFSFLIALPYFD